MVYKTFFYLFLLVFSFSVFAQNQKKKRKENTDYSYLQIFGHDMSDIFFNTSYIFIRPFFWDGRDWLTFGIITAGTAGVSLADETIDTYAQQHQSTTGHTFERIGTDYGEPTLVAKMSLGVYALGLISKNEWLHETGTTLLNSVIISGLIQTVMKIGIGRARPDAKKGQYYFKPNTGAHSFPSGHTVMSMTFVFALASGFDNPFIKGLIKPLTMLSL